MKTKADKQSNQREIQVRSNQNIVQPLTDYQVDLDK